MCLSHSTRSHRCSFAGVWQLIYSRQCVRAHPFGPFVWMCVYLRVRTGWLGSRPCCLSPCWVTKAKPHSLTHIHWGIIRAAKPPLASDEVAGVEGWEASEGKNRGGLDGHELGTYTHTHTHTSDQTAQSKCNTPHPLPGQQLARWWREIDQLGGFPPKMKIDGRISTAVGQPLASFSLLKTAHFHSGGKKEVQGLVVLVVTVIERVRNNKASKRLPFPGLSGSV